MHTFAGSVTLHDGEKVSGLPETWTKVSTARPHGTTVYLSGETDTSDSSQLLESIKQIVGELITYDISHTGDEDTVEVLPTKGDGNYSHIAVHGQTFDEVQSEYTSKVNVLSIRTAEESKHLGGTVIKVDFLK